MRGRNAKGVEHANSVPHQIAAGVAGAPRFIGHRSAGVAVVVANHEPPAVGEQMAEVLLPPEHRPADAHDEKHRRVSRVAERFRAELNSARFDHSLNHVATSHFSPSPELPVTHESVSRLGRERREEAEGGECKQPVTGVERPGVGAVGSSQRSREGAHRDERRHMTVRSSPKRWPTTVRAWHAVICQPSGRCWPTTPAPRS